ncbi:MAG: class I SAM-dependent methyltransferase [Ruminococcus sp.]|nr:class I SAM-dependent methyltransferase [Ruminococcus sp.]
MILPKRLSLIASMVDRGAVVADIGTDHAHLPIYLVNNNVCPSALACDIKESPLKTGRQNIVLCHLEDKIQTRLSDGLSNIKSNEADTFTIAGMGGDMIIHILSSCPYIFDDKYTLILQPMTKYPTLMGWLFDNGFEIIRQECIHEGKHCYTVIKACFSGEKFPHEPEDEFLGKLDLSEEENRLFLIKEIKKAEKRSIGDPTLVPVVEILKEKLQ